MPLYGTSGIFDLLPRQRMVLRCLPIAAGDDVHLRAGLSLQQLAHLIGVHALGIAPVHVQDQVAGLDAVGHRRVALVGFAHHHPVVLLADHGPDAAVLPGGHDAVILHVALGDVLGVGVEAFEHRVDPRIDQLAGVDIVHVIDVDVLVELIEDLQVLAHLEVVVTRGDGERPAR